MLSLMVYFDIFLSLNWSGTSASDAPARYHRTVLAAHHSSAPSSHSCREFADVWIERATEGIPTLLRSTPNAKEPDPSKPAMLMAGIRKKITDVVSEHVQTPGNADFSRPPNLPIASMSLPTVGKKRSKTGKQRSMCREIHYGCTTWMWFFFCRFQRSQISCLPNDRSIIWQATHLPVVQIGLLGLVLLQKLRQHLLQSIRVGLQGGQNVFDGALNQDTVHHAKTFPFAGQRLESFDNKPSGKDGSMWAVPSKRESERCMSARNPQSRIV